MRALWAILAGMALIVPTTSTVARADAGVSRPTGASGVDPDASGDDAAEQAAAEIAAARARANAAAEALFEAESDLDALELQQQALEQDIEVLIAQIEALRATVEQVAVNRFTRAGTDSMPLLTGYRDAGEQAQVDVLIDIVNETSADDFDQFESLNSDLEDAQAELRQAQDDAEAARDELDRRREDALAEVERLKEIEEQRLEDEAVQRALEAQRAAQRARDQAAADELLAEAAAQDAIGTQTQLGSGTVVPDVAVVPAGDIDDIDSSVIDNRSTGGTGGGLTGVTGAGGRPGALAGDLGAAGWVCPVQGTTAFADTWGQARSGGRTHQGVDMIAARGLPIVAVVDGFAQSKVNTLGGNTVALSGVDGNRYYYAHLDEWATLGQVTAGTIIGYVGDTGNAKFSTPHLHFEIHPGGGAAVNPFATVFNHC
ncbi:MAG: peptidoglycan DD-metalloendopeptidase family protein [Acidimicrobiales bacterium]|nr:peptidoglycan DD-metalloendopeptidase family protein [Acidimicrobiales bacterium]MCB9395224.1 peptidoglycan DD-metalloendopeptidase family protein [Acidimicrobiaceae bacterium]